MADKKVSEGKRQTVDQYRQMKADDEFKPVVIKPAKRTSKKSK